MGAIDGALIEQDPDLLPEARLVADELGRRGVEVRWFLHKHLMRGRVATVSEVGHQASIKPTMAASSSCAGGSRSRTQPLAYGRVSPENGYGPDERYS